jgi:hypothetical protein
MITPEQLENRRVRILPDSAHAGGAHCGHCFGEGRDAALYVLVNPEGGGVEAAKVVPARGVTEVHCGHCFSTGREAAIAAWEKGEDVKDALEGPRPAHPIAPTPEPKVEAHPPTPEPKPEKPPKVPTHPS